MADESFVHDESTFDAEAAPASVDLSEAEAKYAELFGEVIWDGVITPEERDRLSTAARVFGLSTDRAAKMEEALTAAYEARHQIQLVDESGEPEAEEIEEDKETLSPLAAAQDPRLQALQRRIAVVEKRNDDLQERNSDLRERAVKMDEALARLNAELALAHQKLERAQAGLDEAASRPDAAAPVAEQAAAPDSASPASDAPRPRTMRDSMLPSTPSAMHAEAAATAGELEATTLVQASRGDPSEIHRLVRRSPRDVELLRALFGTLQRADDRDRRWCIAHVLTYLGEANDEEQALHEQHVTRTVVKPTRAVNKDEWHELLMHPEQDRLTGDIFSEIAPAVLLGQLSALRKEGASSPETGQEVDPKTSKLDAVRCMVWAAAFLGLKLPPITVAADHPGLVDLVLTTRPSSRLGKDALVGHSAQELAFMAGQHLSWYRGEHILGKLTGSTRRLEDMFLAALMIGNPGLPMTDEVKQRVEPLARTIAPLLDAKAVGRLRSYFGVFVEQGGRTNLGMWRRSAEKTAACTGLLLANSLGAAEAILKLEDEAKLEERMDELIVYFTAGRCSLLRKRISIGIVPPS